MGGRDLTVLTLDHGVAPDRVRVGGAWTFAMIIGRCGGIAKMRGSRRGWCSVDDATSGPDVGASALEVC